MARREERPIVTLGQARFLGTNVSQGYHWHPGIDRAKNLLQVAKEQWCQSTKRIYHYIGSKGKS